MIRTVTAAQALILCTVCAASALPPLTQNDRIMGELVAGEVGYQIQKHCPTIKARTFRALGRINDLKSHAKSLGYTDADFQAVSKDPQARALRDAMVEDYLTQHGVKKGDNNSYCVLGYQEIEKNTLTGWLLRAN